MLNCSDTCDTRIKTSGDKPVGTVGVEKPVASCRARPAGPRCERIQTRMVGGMGDAISSAIGVWTDLEVVHGPKEEAHPVNVEIETAGVKS